MHRPQRKRQRDKGSAAAARRRARRKLRHRDKSSQPRDDLAPPANSQNFLVRIIECAGTGEVGDNGELVPGKFIDTLTITQMSLSALMSFTIITLLSMNYSKIYIVFFFSKNSIKRS